MKFTNVKSETRIAIFYAIFGGGWILFSDILLAQLVPDYALYTRFQTYKGWFYVAASAGLIYSLIKRENDKRTETAEKLRASEEALRRFKLLSEHSRDIILFMRREDGCILEGNAAASRAYGYSHDELLTLSVQELRAPGTKALTANQMAQADAGGILFETVHMRKDGSSFPVEVSSQGATVGGVRTLVSIVRDISERKQVEQEMLASRAKLQAALASMTDAVFISDTDGQFVEFNDAFATFHKFTNKNECAKTLAEYPAFLEVFMPNGKPAPLEHWAVSRALRGETGTNVEYILRRIDTGETWVGSYNFAPIRDNDGVIVGSVGTGRDITERKQAEEELHRTLDELKRSNAELEQFAYVASHDLQEPLRGIAGFAQLLQQRYEGQLDSRADEFITHIVEGTQRMQTLINDLLAYSRIGRRGAMIRPTESEAALKATLKNLNVAIQEYGATITSESLPMVKADATQLIQLFQNLVGNAIKFRAERPPQIHIGVADAGDFWQFSVRDNGIGIEPQYFERIFQVFQRLHTRREYKGTGIGLAICKKIIERHSGRFWVESKLGQGSTFYFTLPKGK